MDVFVRYKAIKQRLNSGGTLSEAFSLAPNNTPVGVPVFWYTGQYQKGKDNVSYIAPAIYIEMPKNLKIDYFPRKLQVVKDAQIKIHIVSTAPYKSIDNAMQDAAVEKHMKLNEDVHALLNAFQIKDAKGQLLASQLIITGENTMNYLGSFAFSVLTYKCEFYLKEG
jgi:hypothetical protein